MNNIVVTPNPAKEVVKISGDDLFGVEIYALDGKKAYADQAFKAEHNIQVSDWASNVYVLHITTKDAVYNQQLIVE